MRKAVKRAAHAALLGLTLSLATGAASAIDLGVEGQVFEPIEEDFRLMLLRMVAKKDWTPHLNELQESAENYTKNLPDFYIPTAQSSKTLWKDVGIITSEPIYMPSVDWVEGSVFEPEPVLAVPAGVYLNPIAHIPSNAISRLFIFDATSEEQLEIANKLIEAQIPMLEFLIVAGDLSPISKEHNRPIFHLSADMIDRFQIEAVPSLIGFGKGEHFGHMATTQFTMPVTVEDIENAWYGLPYPGYDPLNEADLELSEQETSQAFEAINQAAEAIRKKRQDAPAPTGVGTF